MSGIPIEGDPEHLPICKAIVHRAFRHLALTRGQFISFSKLMSEDILGGKGKDSYRDLYRCRGPEDRLTGEQIKALVPYFRTKGFEAPDDSFTRDHADPEEGFAYLRFGDTSLPKPLKRGPPKHEGLIDYQIGELSNGIHSIGEDYALDPIFSAKRQSAISELVPLIEKHGLNARQVVAIDTFTSPIKACQTCGAGVQTIGAFQTVLEMVHDRQAKILPKLGNETEYRAFSRVISKVAVRSSVTGDASRARRAASFVARTAADGFLGQANTQRVVDEVKPVRSIIDPKDPAYTKFVENQADAYSEYSDAHMSALQCKACAAVAGRLDEAEFDRSEVYLERFRVGLERSMRKNYGRSDEETDRIKSRMRNADFIGLRFIATKYSKAPNLPARIREYARQHGFDVADMAVYEKAPVRKAQALFWLWLAGDRTRSEYLEMACDLLKSHEYIKNVCAIELAGLRKAIADEKQRIDGCKSSQR